MSIDYIIHNLNVNMKKILYSIRVYLKGVGPQLKYLKKRIEQIKSVILNLPYSETDRSKISN